MNNKSKILVIVILLQLVPIANAENSIFIENFDEINIGDIPDEWVIEQKGLEDQVYVQDNYVISGEKSLYIRETGGDKTNILLLSNKFKATDFEYSFKFRIIGVLQARAIFSLLNNTGGVCILVNCRSGDNWRYRTKDGTWENIPNLSTPLSGHVYSVKMIVDSGEKLVNIIVNDVESGWLQPYSGWDEISHITFNTNYNFPSEFWIDDILVKSNEPITKNGNINIKKKVDWGYKKTYKEDMSFTFHSSWDDEFTLTNGEQVKIGVKPGVYQIYEVLQNGWDLYEIKIEDSSGGSYIQNQNTVIIDVAENDKITITFVNRPPNFVIPETPIGTLGIMFIMILGLFIFKIKNTLQQS